MERVENVILRYIALVFTRVKQNPAPHTAINKPEQLNGKSISFFKEGVFFWLGSFKTVHSTTPTTRHWNLTSHKHTYKVLHAEMLRISWR
jgi:hypothetical protein